ncbi:hypothetical protein HAX54_010435 [Datura stramonium]|uniref:AB hydrolase-1 domain-containing protein n=1 Tax=Datura stramonium TaxID=4076 RepID=A0ABS8TG80_DATST|nr:hypothetical protein [Datura stramonium]
MRRQLILFDPLKIFWIDDTFFAIFSCDMRRQADITSIGTAKKGYVEDARAILMDNSWSVQTTVCWGQRDRWSSFDGVEDFCKESKHRLIELPMSGHHVQEDSGEELGQLIAGIVGKRNSTL